MKIDNIKPIALMSIIGPKTKKATREEVVKVDAKERTKNESTVEQIETSAAKTIIATIEVTLSCPKLKITSLGINTCIQEEITAHFQTIPSSMTAQL